MSVSGRPVSYDRVESFITSGFPDVVFSIDGNTRFIELKTAAMPAKETGNVRFRLQAAQPLWHDRHCAASDQPSYFLIQVGSGRGAMRFGVPWPLLRPYVDREKPVVSVPLCYLRDIGFDADVFFIAEAAS